MTSVPAASAVWAIPKKLPGPARDLHAGKRCRLPVGTLPGCHRTACLVAISGADPCARAAQPMQEIPI
ncbi:hypothetical protein CBM2600_A100002 [Cupriavidus taiwanensis]|nr:hypothetical protein CBM2600_A100002 [Cupriavidus taiwanensis]